MKRRLDMPFAPARRTERRRPAAEHLPLLVLAALPLLMWLFDGSLVALLAAIVHFALLAGAALLIAQGHEAHLAYDAAAVALRPRVPRKLLGSLLLGLLVFLLAAGRFSNLVTTICLALAATGFSVAAFGLDPMRHKGFDDPVYIARRDADALLVRADDALRDVVERVGRLGSTTLSARTEAMHSATMRLLRALATDPRRLLGLDRPLAKYLAMIEAEAIRLEAGWATHPARTARHYVIRLEALTTAFEAGARQRRHRETPDAYALDADLLVERMLREKAA